MFEEKIEQPTEQMIEAKKNALINGIVQDTVELLAKKISDEDIEILLGKKFTEGFGEGQLIYDKITKAFRDSSISEIETITMKIETYKDALEK
jgi:hypothetical protein